MGYTYVIKFRFDSIDFLTFIGSSDIAFYLFIKGLNCEFLQKVLFKQPQNLCIKLVHLLLTFSFKTPCSYININFSPFNYHNQ